MRIGIAGFSGQKFEQATAYSLLKGAFAEVIKQFFDCDLYQVKWEQITVVSGLTNLGIPAIAYDYAVTQSAKTMGIACSKAKDYECFPCDRVHIIGSEWGDESEAFLASIDVLIRIGGGKQSFAECETARARGIHVVDRDLEAIA